MKKTLSEFGKERIITLMPDVTYAQTPFWFNGTLRPLKMDILLPKHRDEAGKQPTLVWVCGGAFQQVDRHIWIPEMVWFAKRGFTVASIEYRTSMEANWPAQIIDVKCAIRFLRANADKLCVDPDRIAIAGESAGGYLANYVGVTGNTSQFDQGDYLDFSSKVQAVVDFYGLSEMAGSVSSSVTDGETIIVKGDAASLLLGCTIQENPELFRKASVSSWVNNTCPPFLILHGDKDPLVNINEQSIKLYDTLIQNGVHAEIDIYSGVSHGADEFYQEATKERIAQFLLNQM